VILTLDKNVLFQVNLRRIAVVIRRARSNRIADLMPVVPECLHALDSIEAGDVVRIGRQ
jgi:hypothetical protein